MQSMMAQNVVWYVAMCVNMDLETSLWNIIYNLFQQFDFSADMVELGI